MCLSSFPNQVLTMGGCNSTPEEREQKRINNQIEKQLYKDKREQSVKILLLGTGHFIGKPSRNWYFLGLSDPPTHRRPGGRRINLSKRTKNTSKCNNITLTIVFHRNGFNFNVGFKKS